MSESMVDRVREAIEEEVQFSCREECCTCTGQERWECMIGANAEELARAAIKAMREPTNAMVKAHKGARYRTNGQSASKTEAIREGHRAAIDFVLSEKH